MTLPVVLVMEKALEGIDTSDCDCGAADGTCAHTIHENNHTGHSVGCPVFRRWWEREHGS